MPRRFFSSKQRAGIGLIPVLLLILLLLAGSFYPCFHALAGGTTTIDASGGYFAYVGNTGPTIRARAQSFQVYAGRLTSFSFNFATMTGTPGDVTWQIQTNNDITGKPSGNLLTSGQVTPAVSTATTVNVVSGPLLSASTTYWLVIYVNNPTNGNYYVWLGSTISVYDQGLSSEGLNGQTSWNNEATHDTTCSITTTDDTPTPSNTPTVTLTYTATATGTLTVVPSDTPTPTLSPTPSNTPVPTWTPTPTPNLFVIVTLTTGQQVAVKYEITAGDAMSGALLVMLLCFSIFGVFMQTRRRRLQ